MTDRTDSDAIDCPGCRTDYGWCHRHTAGEIVEAAETFMRTTLSNLPRRIAHSLGVAATSRHLSAHWHPHARDILTAAALLHDIGYAAPITGHHAIDGALLLTGTRHEPLAPYVAWHSTAAAEANQRGLSIDWRRPHDATADLLWIADFTTSPDGDPVSAQTRLTEIRSRYTPDSPVIAALDASHDEFVECLARHNVPYDTPTRSVP